MRETVISEESAPQNYKKSKNCCIRAFECVRLLGPTRSPRVIVQLISDLPKSFFKENFPKDLWLKILIRAPMVLLLMVAAMITGLNMCLFKVIGEAITSGVPIWSAFVMFLTLAGLGQAVI